MSNIRNCTSLNYEELIRTGIRTGIISQTSVGKKELAREQDDQEPDDQEEDNDQIWLFRSCMTHYMTVQN